MGDVYQFSAAQKRKALMWLVFWHIVVIASSNYLVQFPVKILGVQTTWGAFTFPFIFLTTDLTVRIFGSPLARRIIFVVMFPALLVSYLVSVLFHDGVWQGVVPLATFDSFVGRIALASFTAYCVGQLLDILVFNHLRALPKWWAAPSASTVLGSAVDTAVFFSVAFYRSSDPFMAEHWMQIGFVDYLIKLAICAMFFLPLYGVILNALLKKLTTLRERQIREEKSAAAV